MINIEEYDTLMNKLCVKSDSADVILRKCFVKRVLKINNNKEDEERLIEEFLSQSFDSISTEDILYILKRLPNYVSRKESFISTYLKEVLKNKL